VGILALFVAIDGVLVLATLRPPPVAVHVTAITWVSGGVLLSHGPGFSTRGGTQFTLTLIDTNDAWSIISYSSAAVSSGFTVVSENLPIVAPGTTENLTVQVTAPNSAFTGPLVVTLA
jgi:hypothetical protein